MEGEKLEGTELIEAAASDKNTCITYISYTYIHEDIVILLYTMYTFLDLPVVIMLYAMDRRYFISGAVTSNAAVMCNI